MKYLLLFVIFMLLLWQWRHARQPKVRQAESQSAPATGLVTMEQCAHCGVHLPAGDAIKGKKGWYCSVAHRQAQEP